MIYVGILFLASGIALTIINLLASRFGTPHPRGVVLAIVALVAAAALGGGAFVMHRSERERTPG
jgi:predicted MFS family arabinose efflux permease